MNKELIRQLRRIGTDKHHCLGCGFEHNCSIHGCAVINKAIRLLDAPEQLPQAKAHNIRTHEIVQNGTPGEEG